MYVLRLCVEAQKHKGESVNRIFVALVAMGGLFFSVSAEESGLFVGVQAGYGAGKSISEYNGEKTPTKRDGAAYGLIAGYKQFFAQHFGIRYYFNIDFLDTSGTTVAGENVKANLTNYAVNIDTLYNFLTGDIDFGTFLGIGLGANTWGGPNINTIKSYGKVTTTGFGVHLNVGLRTNIAKYHGIELALKVPFVPTKLLDVTFTENDIYRVGDRYKSTAQQTYNIALRYVFSF